MIKHWTPEEEKLLIEGKLNKVPLAEIAEQLGRSLEAVRTRSKRVNHQIGAPKKSLIWNEDEISLLYEDLDYDELESLLPYTRRAIKSQCEKRGINKRFGKISGIGTMYQDKPTTLYLVDFGRFKKIGVTQVSLEERFKQDGKFTILDTIELSLDEALEFERIILKNMRPHRTVGTVRRGFNECFIYDCRTLEELL
jgi:hypothetical protein